MVEGPSLLPAYGRGTGFLGGLGPSLGAKTFRPAEQRFLRQGGYSPLPSPLSPALCVLAPGKAAARTWFARWPRVPSVSSLPLCRW